MSCVVALPTTILWVIRCDPKRRPQNKQGEHSKWGIYTNLDRRTVLDFFMASVVYLVLSIRDQWQVSKTRNRFELEQRREITASNPITIRANPCISHTGLMKVIPGSRNLKELLHIQHIDEGRIKREQRNRVRRYFVSSARADSQDPGTPGLPVR